MSILIIHKICVYILWGLNPVWIIELFVPCQHLNSYLIKFHFVVLSLWHNNLCQYGCARFKGMFNQLENIKSSFSKLQTLVHLSHRPANFALYIAAVVELAMASFDFLLDHCTITTTTTKHSTTVQLWWWNVTMTEKS